MDHEQEDIFEKQIKRVYVGQFMNNSSRMPKVVIVGRDHGKSSLIGRMMYDLQEVPDGKYEELKKVSEKRGMEFEFAFLLDALQAERDQGITIDTTQIFLKTKKENMFLLMHLVIRNLLKI